MLWHNWESLIQGREGKLPFDFAQATVEPKDSTVELKVGQYQCGVFSKSANAETCKSALINIQNRFVEKVAKLHDTGKHLVTNATELRRRLRETLEGIEKYQLGKKFKKLKNCPGCQKF